MSPVSPRARGGARAGRRAPRARAPLPQGAAATRAYVRMLSDGAPAQELLELRWRTQGGAMRRTFIPLGETGRALALLARLAPHGDVYVGVAPRASARHGGRAGIRAGRLAWVDSDHPATAGLLAHTVPKPSMIVASGTPDHLHIYWRLSRPVAVRRLEALNRSLTLALRGDPASCDAARILRPPGTLNHKHAPPAPVLLLRFEPLRVCDPEALAAALPADPRPQKPALTGRRRASVTDRALLAIPAATYAHVLAGLTPGRDRKALCPFHRERHPSLHLYPDGSFYCFGCRAGGSIYDFAAQLWGIEPRGAGFLELRGRLARIFPGAQPP